MAKTLGRATAMNHARVELAGLGLGEKNRDGSVTLRNSEVLDSFVCREQTFALARLAKPEGFEAVEIPACGANMDPPTSPPDATCPAWTRAGAWRVGDAVVAVGSVSGIKNRALATKTARNRADAEARKVAMLTVKVTDTGVSASSSGAAPGIPTDAEMVECDGILYTKVIFERPR